MYDSYSFLVQKREIEFAIIQGTTPKWAVCSYGGLGHMFRRFIFGDDPIRPLSFSANWPQAAKMYLPRLPPKFSSTWHPSPCRLLMVCFQTSPPTILWPLPHSTHPSDLRPLTVWPRLHQGVCFPHPSTSSHPAGPTSVLRPSLSASRFKFFFLY